MFLAALPWTYWMALPLLVGSLMVLLSFGLVYLKRVVEPNVLRLDALAAAGPAGLTGGRQPALVQGNVERRLS